MYLTYDEGVKIDTSGNLLEYKGNQVYGVWKNTKPIPTELIKEVLGDIKFPIEKLKAIKLFNFPYRLMTYKNGWTGAYYHGRAFATHIVYGARADTEEVTKNTIGALIIHELGHALMYLACDCTYENHMKSSKFQEYIRLRGIPNNWNPDSIWAKRPAEVFAEDFRFIFGEAYMKEEQHTVVEKEWLPNPPNKIREFMLNLLNEISYTEKEDELEVDQMAEFKDTKGHWAEKQIDVMKKYGVMQGDPDGNFRPNDPLTRGEYAHLKYNEMVEKGQIAEADIIKKK